MIALALILLALALAWPTPRLMARAHVFRRAPRAALFVWQSVTLSAILAALAATPAIAPLVLFDGQTVAQHFMLIALAVVVSGTMLGRLLWAGHHIGRRMRVLRHRHREVVDIIALDHDADSRIRVLAHPAPTAYCLPGRESRVVVSRGVIEAMPPLAFQAVLLHEDAHLKARHDLLVEFFSVIHETVPAPLRSAAAMHEVRLLVEALADRAAARRVGTEATRQALVALAGSRAPEAAMAAGVGSTSARFELLGYGSQPALSALMYAYAALLLALPMGLIAAAWL
jgi:Zn-dependent protease with chaperone function